MRCSTVSKLHCSITAHRASRSCAIHSASPKRSPDRLWTIKCQAEDDVYIGDGKVIQDDASKYPSKEDAGVMQGATGGWAGGEVGLQRFVEDVQPTEGSETERRENDNRQPKKVGEGSDTLYVGFDYKNPDDVTAMREGEQGNFIIDDGQKYPDRDFLGWLPLQGGFAGGEIGLKKFIEDGDIQIAGPKEKGQKQMSPVLVGIFTAAVATTGGLILTGVIDFGENFSFNVDRAQIDEKTRFILEAAVGLLLAAWGGSAAFAFFKSIRERFNPGTSSSPSKVTISVLVLVVVVIITVASYNLAKP